VFVQHQGHNHVIIALSWPTFNNRFSAFCPALSRNYRKLQNVTVAHNYDPFGSLQLRNNTKMNGDFQKMYNAESPVANAFSLGLGFNDFFPLQTPTYGV